MTNSNSHLSILLTLGRISVDFVFKYSLKQKYPVCLHSVRIALLNKFRFEKIHYVSKKNALKPHYWDSENKPKSSTKLINYIPSCKGNEPSTSEWCLVKSKHIGNAAHHLPSLPYY